MERVNWYLLVDGRRYAREYSKAEQVGMDTTVVNKNKQGHPHEDLQFLTLVLWIKHDFFFYHKQNMNNFYRKGIAYISNVAVQRRYRR